MPGTDLTAPLLHGEARAEAGNNTATGEERVGVSVRRSPCNRKRVARNAASYSGAPGGAPRFSLRKASDLKPPV